MQNEKVTMNKKPFQEDCSKEESPTPGKANAKKILVNIGLMNVRN